MSEGTGYRVDIILNVQSYSTMFSIHYIERTRSYNFQCNCKYDKHLGIFFPEIHLASFSSLFLYVSVGFNLRKHDKTCIIKYYTIQLSILYKIIQCKRMQFNIKQYNMIKHNIIKCNTTHSSLDLIVMFHLTLFLFTSLHLTWLECGREKRKWGPSVFHIIDLIADIK